MGEGSEKMVEIDMHEHVSVVMTWLLLTAGKL